LKPPCVLDSDTLENDMIPEWESALEDWDRAIAQRRALLKARRAGRFGFIARAVDKWEDNWLAAD